LQTFFEQGRESFQMRPSEVLLRKIKVFRKLWVLALHGQEGVEAVRTRKEAVRTRIGQFLATLCVRILWTPLNHIFLQT